MRTRVVAFTVAYDGRVNVLKSPAHISKAFNPLSYPKPPSPEAVGAREYTAIWDTGATSCVITQKVVDDCGLKPIGMTKVQTAKGEDTTLVYLASIFLPNKVIIPVLRMVRGIIAGDAEVLIGMDIINQGDFAVTNKDGKTTFSFRIPSIECIDFVKQRPPGAIPSTTRPIPKVGRNDPCPCGSGKKYKKCCGK